MESHRYEDESLAPRYVRNLIWSTRNHTRNATGWEGIIEAHTGHGRGAHHYQLPDNTLCDLWDFQERLDRADQLTAHAAAMLRQQQLSWPVGPGEPGGPPASPARDEAQVVLAQAATLREEALQLYRGDFCQGSTNDCLANAARFIEERYIRSALQQGDYWYTVAQGLQEAYATGVFESKQPVADQRVGQRHLAHPPHPPHPDHASSQSYLEVKAIWREALRNYERVLRVDAYREEAYIHVMHCHALLGDARGLGLTFKRYREVLHKELQLKPGPRVTLAYNECKALLSVIRRGLP